MSKKPAKIVILVLYFTGLGVLVSLGGWQLGRGLEKQAIDRKLVAGEGSRIRLDQSRENWQTLNHRQVDLDGKWLPEKVFLMENRVYNGIVGHELWVPFMLADDDTVILVNLGWSADVQTLPGAGTDTGAGGHEDPPPRSGRGQALLDMGTDMDNAGNVTVKGQLTLPEPGFTLGPAFTDQSTWPRRIQYFDRAGLGRALGLSIAPAVLIIDPGESQSLTRIWKPYTMNATRHIGYAVQWWGLAVTLIVFGIIWLRASRRQKFS